MDTKQDKITKFDINLKFVNLNFKIISDMDNHTKKTEELNPVIIMGNKAFKLADFSDNNPDVMAAINEWGTKKEKALERADKRYIKNKTKKL